MKTVAEHKEANKRNKIHVTRTREKRKKTKKNAIVCHANTKPATHKNIKYSIVIGWNKFQAHTHIRSEKERPSLRQTILHTIFFLQISSTNVMKFMCFGFLRSNFFSLRRFLCGTLRAYFPIFVGALFSSFFSFSSLGISSPILNGVSLPKYKNKLILCFVCTFFFLSLSFSRSLARSSNRPLILCSSWLFSPRVHNTYTNISIVHFFRLFLYVHFLRHMTRSGGKMVKMIHILKVINSKFMPFYVSTYFA